MFCPNCGNEIPDNSTFCTYCGAKILRPGESAEEPVPQASSRPSPGIELCGDGMYRWYYEFSMIKNPMILFTVLKVIGAVFGIMILFFLFFVFRSDGVEGLKENLLPLSLFVVFFFVLTLVGYLILAAMYGWKYIVLFEMNEDGVNHIQEPQQFKKTQAIAWMSAISGIASGRPLDGISRGLIVGTRNATYTTFKNVKRMKSVRGFHTIKLNETLNHNQIYVSNEDYDFVLDYIVKHLPDTAKRNV